MTWRLPTRPPRTASSDHRPAHEAEPPVYERHAARTRAAGMLHHAWFLAALVLLVVPDAELPDVAVELAVAMPVASA